MPSLSTELILNTPWLNVNSFGQKNVKKYALRQSNKVKQLDAMFELYIFFDE
ncbi:hypothetical protein FDUTEX481_07733 [Tolypothrix sp. PCC 7601]|nr:hypothetical protein FDUTEX481_07733 [Tolypothrix sp. PCC 7601]BAY88707.1 hypothetical protein NIES3275_07070 [Microchaete diplosiphon NIES-3275]